MSINHEEGLAVFDRICSALTKADPDNQGLTEEKAIGILRLTPGIFFRYETTWKEIIKSMVRWEWLKEKDNKIFTR